MAKYPCFIRNCTFAVAALLACTAMNSPAHAVVKPGESPTAIALEGNAGGRVDGQAWRSDSMKGKVQVLFYVDPDEKGANEALENDLKAAQLPHDKFGTIAVINMKASWLPNAAIASSLEAKQKTFPEVVYVKDMNKTLVRQWGLKDDAYVVALFDKQGKLLFVKDGTFSSADTSHLIEMVKKHLDDPKS